MADPIGSVKGITPELASKMKAHNIADTDALLAATADQGARRKLAADLAIEPAKLTEFINRADLCRLNGVAGVYADLLEYAGVDSVKELSHRTPANLQAKLTAANEQHKLTSRPPTLSQVESWVTEARGLNPS